MQLGIKSRIFLLTLAPTIITALLSMGYFIGNQLKELKESFYTQGKALALKTGTASEYGVFSNNQRILEHLATSTLKKSNVTSVSFYTPTGEKIASAGKVTGDFLVPTFPKSASPHVLVQDNRDTTYFIVPIVIHQEPSEAYSALHPEEHADTLIGWMNLELETKSIKLREYQLLTQASLILMLGLLISLLFAYRLRLKLAIPLLDIGKAVKKMKDGALNTRVQINAYPELKTLSLDINHMAETLDKAQQELQCKIDEATLSLRRTLETIEVQNIELEISRRAAENANKIKSEFLADMSHEIRTPLNSVIGFINLLQKTPLDEKQQMYILTVQKSAHNLLSILNDILDFSKIEAGKLRIERSTMDIRECIDETLNLLAPYANEKNITLIPLIYSNVPTQVLSDPLRIKQVVTNLVSNAIKFTNHGSVIVRVMLENESPPYATIRIYVTDTGVGLSEVEQKGLFQAFNQTKSEVSHKLGGTGLGLVICKKLVEQMGGTIGVESKPEQGSTFWFTFQVEMSLNTSKSAILDNNMEFQPKTFLTTNPLHISATILAVDDNPENLKLLSILLGDLGSDITTASNGQSAIECIKTKTFDLILMDIRMPDMDGIETSRIIRTIEMTQHQKPTPIVALTAHALINDQKIFLENGINDFLIKPIQESELMRILQKWIKPKSLLKTIDWELGQKLAGGNLTLAKEFFEKLIAQLPHDQQKINDLYQKKDFKQLRDAVHKLHGACCYCGVPQLKNTMNELETVIANEQFDKVKSHMDQFNIASNALLNEAALSSR